MKTRRVWRYTCEHCKKANCSKPSMVLHEGRCFHNPARRCSMCQAQWPLPELAPLMAALSDVTDATEAALIAPISEAVEGCPACICAALRQSDTTRETDYKTFEGNVCQHKTRHWFSWDYKKARDEWMDEQRREEVSYMFPTSREHS